jgi:hypothetical protein
MKKALSTLVLLVAWLGIAWGYSGSAQITVKRTMSATSVAQGGSASVTLTASIGSVASAIRGFYVTDYVPGGFTVSNVTVTKNGTAITTRIKRETNAGQTTYPGFTLERWALETPTAWSENNPLDPMTTLVITYTLSVPSSATVKTYAMPGFSWVAMIPSQGTTGDIYGYEEPAPSLTVTGSTGPVAGKLAIASATASSVENATLAAAKAIDGNTGTRWSSAFSEPQWIVFDLGAQHTIKSVVFYWQNSSGKVYKVQGSNDAAFGGTPTDLYSFTATACGTRTDSLTVSNAGTFRYVRMLGTTRCSAYGFSMWEARIYGN